MSNSLLGPGNVPRITGIHHPVKGMERLGSKTKLSVNSTFPTTNSLNYECVRAELSNAKLSISTKYTAQNTTPKSHRWFQKKKKNSTEQMFWNPCKPKRSITRHKRYQVEKKSENALSVNIDNAIKCYIRTAYL